MAIKTIHAKAPTRIDLGGGTLDLWPLYLFLKNPLTINLAIDLYAEVELQCEPAKNRGKAEIALRSEDQNESRTLSWERLFEEHSIPPQLDLSLKLLRHFAPQAPSPLKEQDLRISTRAKSPAGAGIGGSSSLNIALTGALASWAWDRPLDLEKDGETLIAVARDVETTVIQVPAGLQDYYGATYGGLQSIHWMPNQQRRIPFPETTQKEIQSRMLLFFSGESRNSGINNWDLFKKFIDRSHDVRDKFQAIADATLDLEGALQNSRWVEASLAMEREWEVRCSLAPGIVTPRMNEAFSLARKQARLSGRVCGAGGGGCFIVYSPELKIAEDRALRDQIQDIFSSRGIRPLAFNASSQGLEVRTQRA